MYNGVGGCVWVWVWVWVWVGVYGFEFGVKHALRGMYRKKYTYMKYPPTRHHTHMQIPLHTQVPTHALQYPSQSTVGWLP